MSARVGIQKGAGSVFLAAAPILAQSYLDAHRVVLWLIVLVSGSLFLWMWKPWKVLTIGWRGWAEQEAGALPSAPEVALVWDWTDDQKKAKNLLGLTGSSKGILIENRSDEWVDNIQVGDLKLDQTLTFDPISTLAPRAKVETTGRWDGRSSTTVEYCYFFTGDENERLAERYGWKIKKTHNRGLNDYFLRLPFRVFFEWKGQKCMCQYELTYEQMGPTFFKRIKCEPVKPVKR